MPQIVLNAEQSRLLTETLDLVEVRDEQGNLLTRLIPPALEAEIAKARRSQTSTAPRWPAAQVKALLARLTEIRAQAGMNETQMRELIERFQKGQSI